MNNTIRSMALGLGFAMAGMAGSAQAATWQLTYEAPGVVNTTSTFTSYGVETFDGLATGTQTYTSTYGGSPYSGTYSQVQVLGFDQYGGAGGSGNYANGNVSGYSLSLATDVNYFGFWLSALNTGNVLTFKQNGQVVGVFDAGNIISAAVQSNPAYKGNPAGLHKGKVMDAEYVFVNFYLTDGYFDALSFATPYGTGFESDNHTVGIYATQSGTPVSVPEPGMASLLALGLASMGALRRRQRA